MHIFTAWKILNDFSLRLFHAIVEEVAPTKTPNACSMYAKDSIVATTTHDANKSHNFVYSIDTYEMRATVATNSIQRHCDQHQLYEINAESLCAMQRETPNGKVFHRVFSIEQCLGCDATFTIKILAVCAPSTTMIILCYWIWRGKNTAHTLHVNIICAHTHKHISTNTDI